MTSSSASETVLECFKDARLSDEELHRIREALNRACQADDTKGKGKGKAKQAHVEEEPVEMNDAGLTPEEVRWIQQG